MASIKFAEELTCKEREHLLDIIGAYQGECFEHACSDEVCEHESPLHRNSPVYSFSENLRETLEGLTRS
jgi:hypothetical protein